MVSVSLQINSSIKHNIQVVISEDESIVPHTTISYWNMIEWGKKRRKTKNTKCRFIKTEINFSVSIGTYYMHVMRILDPKKKWRKKNTPAACTHKNSTIHFDIFAASRPFIIVIAKKKERRKI